MNLAEKLLVLFEDIYNQYKIVKSLELKIKRLRNEISAKHTDPKAKQELSGMLHDTEHKLRMTRAA